MKKYSNCQGRGSNGIMWHCPFLRHPAVHSGYTGKSGDETWWQCSLVHAPIRHIISCRYAGESAQQRLHPTDGTHPIIEILSKSDHSSAIKVLSNPAISG